MRVALMIGSLREGSYNARVAHAMTRLAPAEVQFAISRIDDLPPYNQDDDKDQAPPVRRLKEEIAGADGVMFATPEYNRSVPGVLKNAIDHASRPYGLGAWAGKPAGILGVSVGAIGTATAQQHLRNILAYLDMPTLGQPEVFLQWKDGLVDEGGNIGEDSREFLGDWINKFLAWVRLHPRR
ncbi:NADPH-dependent FMN reductase [uncultured Sphingomonas sp.]|uniref:NADPH-dependent FMN reductase n=1 Tax=uncultured Sphingomonas sp. TaxID=158754 RepID=UPI0025D158B2|nr:NADPH-dependent FMN reductase [uncultured Sphingomonas sp.]